MAANPYIKEIKNLQSGSVLVVPARKRAQARLALQNLNRWDIAVRGPDWLKRAVEFSHLQVCVSSDLLITPAQASGLKAWARARKHFLAQMAATARAESCTWELAKDLEQSQGLTYEGSCGIIWELIEGTLAENQVNYCPQCGGKVHA